MRELTLPMHLCLLEMGRYMLGNAINVSTQMSTQIATQMCTQMLLSVLYDIYAPYVYVTRQVKHMYLYPFNALLVQMFVIHTCNLKRRRFASSSVA